MLKVTGRAPYAADLRPEGVLHAVTAVAGIARGTVTHLDTDAAMAHPGVVRVYTPANRPPLAVHPDTKIHGFAWKTEALQDDTVRYAGQPIALVVAETLEAATEGARLLNPQYRADRRGSAWTAMRPMSRRPSASAARHRCWWGTWTPSRAGAAHHVDTVIETAAQYHNALEPHAITADGSATGWRSTRRTRPSACSSKAFRPIWASIRRRS